MMAIPNRKLKAIALSVCAIISFCAVAQYEPVYNNKGSKNMGSDRPIPQFYLGAGSGLHYKYGLLGIGLGYRVTPATIAELNFGIGGYGTKVSLTGVFNVQNSNAWCPTLGLTKTSGIQDYDMDVNLDGMGSTKTKAKINLDPMLTLNPGIQRQILTKNGGRFVIEMGVAIGLNKQVYGFASDSLMVNQGMVSTSQLKFSSSQKNIFSGISPTGFSFGLSYHFGFKPKESVH